MGVVVPSMSRRTTRTRWSIKVTVESLAVMEDKKAPSTPAGNCDRSRYACSGVSNPTGLETSEWPESFGLRKDRTNARFLAAHESGRRTLPQLQSAGPGAGECETVPDHE